MLVATAALAVVAISAAVIAVRAARRIALAPQTPAEVVSTPAQSSTEVALREPTPVQRTAALEPRVVEGRLIVPPSEQQVVKAALGRPGVRLSILAHGVAHALRAESRDRIAALMRREYRRRRRERLRAGRQAVRAGHPTPPADEWLGSS